MWHPIRLFAGAGLFGWTHRSNDFPRITKPCFEFAQVVASDGAVSPAGLMRRMEEVEVSYVLS